MSEMHILAVIMLHQHIFCVYKGKRKLKLSITCENFVLFALYQFLFYFLVHGPDNFLLPVTGLNLTTLFDESDICR